GSHLGGEVNQPREEVAHRDSLEHSRNAHCRKMKIREARQKLAEEKYDDRTNGDFGEQPTTRIAPFNALSECQRNGYANDKQEERKDQIGGRPAIPLCMFERPKNV